jgi:hypothetical protein
MKPAKLFFREALLLDPGVIDCAACEAPFVRELAMRIREEGISEDALPYWIPVYGTILGVFTVKRELKPVEIGRLSQSILELEQRYSRNRENRDKALLLNRYFWLVDHYSCMKAPKEDIDEVLQKIKLLDPDIFERYIQ